MIKMNNCVFIAGADTHQARTVCLPASPPRAPSVVHYITLTAAIAPCNVVALFRRRPNPAVKRTYPGVAALRSHRAPSAPVYAAYLVR